MFSDLKYQKVHFPGSNVTFPGRTNLYSLNMHPSSGNGQHLSCPEKERLLSAYSAAAAEYSSALQDLNADMGVVPRAHYNRLRQRVEAARAVSERARTALEKHVQNHGCDVASRA
jgi:hypothetical protein